MTETEYASLHEGSLYWPVTLDRPPLSTDPLHGTVRTQAAIIGGGLSGALCAHELTLRGISCVLVDKNSAAGGSTLANTGLLQFCNDRMLKDLAGEIGEQSAALFYRACRDGVAGLGRLAAALPDDTGFAARSSLYFASTPSDVPALREECAMLQKYGFDAAYWTEEDIARRFPFRKAGAIVTGGDAEINPYRFVRSLLDASMRRGLKLYEHTEVLAHDWHGTGADGNHVLTASDGRLIADFVLYTVGYELEQLETGQVEANINRSFAIVTEPFAAPLEQVWHKRCLLWETARPYLYLRTTPDNRIIAGGLDEAPAAPLADADARRKRADKLLASVRELFPPLAAEARIAYEWSASFGESDDYLPYIGEDPVRPGVYYCLGYGGNGSVYSMIGSQLIADAITGQPTSPVSEIVSLRRPALRV